MFNGYDVFTICITAVCAAVAVFYLASKVFKNEKYPPGPMGLPLVGYLPFLGKHRPSKFAKLSKSYGPVFSVKIGFKSVVVLNDYECIRKALVNNGDVFSGRPQLHIFRKISEGLGIVFRNFDDDFKTQSKFASTTLRGFGVGKRSMEERIIEEIEYLTDVIRQKNGECFNCQNALSRSVSNVICSVVLGSRFSYDDEIFQTMVDRFSNTLGSKTDAVCINIMLFAPWLRHLPPFSAVYKRFFITIKFAIGNLQRILDDHKRTLDVKNTRDFIDEYLKHLLLHSGEKDSSFTERQLLQVIRDFFVAGTQTAANTLRWSMLLFAHRPEIQEKVAKEIRDVIGERIPSMQHKDAMPFTCAFIEEIMRHRTMVPLSIVHETTEDVTFMGYHIPKGTAIMSNIWAVHHDPGHFKNPNDFTPERFINEEGVFVHDKHVIPFSIGPRHCLGKHLARMEIFLFLTSIIQKFEIVPDPKRPLPDFNTAVPGILEVSYPFEVSFKERK